MAYVRMADSNAEYEAHKADQAAAAEAEASALALREQAAEDGGVELRRKGLLALVATGGGVRRAHELLADNGVDVPYNTLASWKRRYPDEYDQLRDETAPQLERTIVRELRETVLYAARVERLAIERAEERLAKGIESNPAGIAANLSRVKSVATDKLLALTGRPQQVVEHRSYHEIVRSLAAKGVIELPPSEVQELPTSSSHQDAA